MQITRKIIMIFLLLELLTLIYPILNYIAIGDYAQLSSDYFVVDGYIMQESIEPTYKLVYGSSRYQHTIILDRYLHTYEYAYSINGRNYSGVNKTFEDLGLLSEKGAKIKISQGEGLIEKLDSMKTSPFEGDGIAVAKIQVSKKNNKISKIADVNVLIYPFEKEKDSSYRFLFIITFFFCLYAITMLILRTRQFKGE